jgi:Mrp family chromosome partitioning ATPase
MIWANLRVEPVSVRITGLKPRPALVDNFFGREDVLSAMRQTHLTKRLKASKKSAITVLSGLGGAGKTQTALKFALEFEDA